MLILSLNMGRDDVKLIMAKLRKLLVRKANDLIEARNYLTTAEKKAFAIAVAFAEKIVNEVYGIAEIDFDVLRTILEEENLKVDKHFRDRLRRVLKGLVSKRELALIEIPINKYKEWLKENNKEDWIKKLGLEEYNEGFIFCGVIDDIVLSEDRKKIVVRFNRFITPMVLELRKRFTVYELKYVLLLSTQYGPQLYELLKRNEFLGSFVIEVEELKKFLGADTPGYKYWTQFYERVLKPAIEDINQKTDLSVQMEFTKGLHGKVNKVKFIIKPKRFLENPSKIRKLVTNLVSSFQQGGEDITLGEFAKTLLSLERVNPAIVIWFLLHYPEGEARLYAWEHVRITEENSKIKYPDKYLESLIRDKNPDLDWLLDQRTKDLIRKELEKIVQPEKKEELPKEVSEKVNIKEIMDRIVEKVKGLNEKYKHELKTTLGVDNFKNYLLELARKKNVKKLKEVEQLVDKLWDKQWNEEFSTDYP